MRKLPYKLIKLRNDEPIGVPKYLQVSFIVWIQFDNMG